MTVVVTETWASLDQFAAGNAPAPRHCCVARHEGLAEIEEAHRRHWPQHKIHRFLTVTYPAVPAPSITMIGKHFTGACCCDQTGRLRGDGA